MGTLSIHGLDLAWICFLFIVLQVFVAGAVIPTTQVNTTGGPVVGKNETLATGKSVLKFLGIPYAKARRFEDPTDPDSWNMTRNATQFGKICPQLSMNGSGLMQSEDCLFINVFVPATLPNPNQNLPTMVWIHGGGYLVGSSAEPLYDGRVLATEEGVIVVTSNYRLGALGFLSTGSDSNIKGNYGMLDQVHALKWVQKNIRRFGGDPNEVTIFGESAGGSSVSLLMLSPLAKGLYKNAIQQSGAASAGFAVQLDDEAKVTAKKFADALGCPNLSELKDCAMMKNLSDIITAQLKIKIKFMIFPFGPVIDGNFLKDTPLKILREGAKNQTKVNVMMGVTRDEGTLAVIAIPGIQDAIPDVDQLGVSYSDFVKKVNSTTWVRGQNEAILKSIFQEYTNWANTSDGIGNRQGLVDSYGDAAFNAPAVLSAQLYAKLNAHVYFYQLEYSTDVDLTGKRIPEWRRVPHVADIQYVFGLPLLNASKLADGNDTDVKFSRTVMGYWATFARTGDPNPSSGQNAVQWPRYTSSNQQYLSLKPTPEVKSNLLAARMNFWNSYVDTLKSEEKKPCPKDLTQELEEKDDIILGLAIAVGVLGLLVIILIIAVICMKRKSKSVNIS